MIHAIFITYSLLRVKHTTSFNEKKDDVFDFSIKDKFRYVILEISSMSFWLRTKQVNIVYCCLPSFHVSAPFTSIDYI